jgi:hypothetical protein
VQDGARVDGDGAPLQPGAPDAVGGEAIALSIAVTTGAPEGHVDESMRPSDETQHEARGPDRSASAPRLQSNGSGPTVPPTEPTTDAGAAQAPPVRQGGGCTTAQLRRFIKSRAYIPIHEIRRRFLIATEDDDVSGIDLEHGRIFVGLPPREGQMLGELLRGGEVGYELQLDPVAPVVVGVYPMRPVSRG